MSVMASQITSLTIVCSGADQRKHQSSASLAFVRGIHRWPVNFSHKGPVTRKMFPFDDVIMWVTNICAVSNDFVDPFDDVVMKLSTGLFQLILSRHNGTSKTDYSGSWWDDLMVKGIVTSFIRIDILSEYVAGSEFKVVEIEVYAGYGGSGFILFSSLANACSFLFPKYFYCYVSGPSENVLSLLHCFSIHINDF